MAVFHYLVKKNSFGKCVIGNAKPKRGLGHRGVGTSSEIIDLRWRESSEEIRPCQGIRKCGQ